MVEDRAIPPNQECGDCTVCCRELIIDVPGLTKYAGELCKHGVLGNGCAIYPDRPQTCRDFHCGWRRLPLPEEWRPDRCHILLSAEPADPEKGIAEGWKFFFFGSLDRIFWRPFIEFASALIAQDKVVYISVPGPLRNCARMQAIVPTPELKQAIAGWNYAAVVGVVAALVQSCLDAPEEAVVFKNPHTD